MLFLCLFNKSLAQSGVPEKAYEAHIEKFEGNRKIQRKVLYDKGCFRSEESYPVLSGQPPGVSIYVYDKSLPTIVWGYQKQKPSAWASYESCCNALMEISRREGEVATRKKFLISPTFTLNANRSLLSDLVLRTLSTLGKYTWRKDKQEKIAEYLCDVMLAEYQPPQSKDKIVQRAWVEPHSGLVLQWESRYLPGAGSPVPPIFTGYRVKSLKFLKSVPIARFQLPPGAIANVPAIFKTVKLPKGVKRVPATGAFAALGMDISGGGGGGTAVISGSK